MPVKRARLVLSQSCSVFAVGREPQVVDHRVDVVFQLGDFAARVDLDRAREVALSHGGGDLGEWRAPASSDLAAKRLTLPVQVLPGAGSTRHGCLAAQATLDADLARDGWSPGLRK